MLLQSIDRNELQQVLTQLEQALYNHQQWHNNLLRILACRLPPDQHDLTPKAHKECRFGQWYYSTTSSISNNAGFIAIGEAHQRMHQLATQLLTTLVADNTVAIQDYDSFANSLERLRLEINALKHEIEVLLYNRDPLTMAINRVTMLPILREQQDSIRRRPQPCCLAMIDLDFFKKVNDEHGHLIGDKVLIAIVHYFIEHLRPYDKIFRYGGEEFLIYLQQINIEQAYEMLNRLREDITAMPIEVGLPTPIYITISCGLTMLDPNTTVEQCIDYADKALYIAKSSGRNRIEIWKSPN